MFLSGTVVLLVTLVLPGCGGSSNKPVAVGLSSSISGNSIDQGQTDTITATVLNDAKNAGVQWGASGGGSLTGQTVSSATYNAPASVSAAFTATITATSISDPTKSSSLQIKVNPLPAITTTSLPQATAGIAYSATLAVSGGASPYKWGITSGTLPAGLSLNSSSGVISGIPTGASSSSVTFEVTDGAGNTASQAISITVAPPPPLTITTTSLPGGTNGTPYTQTLQASEGVPPYTWLLTSGSLPPGLTLSSNGAISGTPSGTTTTTFTFTVSVTDSETPTRATKTATLSIAVTQPPLSIVTTSLAGGSVGNPYSQTLQAIGGMPPYTWSILAGTLPAGVSLNPGTGAITGTPTGTGTFPITVNVTDSAHTTVTSQPLTIVISTALAITTTSLPGGSVGTAYSATLEATGGAQPYTWSVSSGTLPSGLSLNSSSGIISGTPTASGSSSFTVQVADSESPAVIKQATFSITISSASCPDNFTLKGNYAFVTNGWSTTQPTATSSLGSFAADGNGNISSGQLDIADQNSSFGPASGTFTGTYCVASSRLATINLTYGGTLSGGNTFIAALDSSDNNGHIISYDDSGLKVSGLLRQQNTSAFSTSKISGPYAFGLVGADQAANRYAMAGEFVANGSATLSGTDDNNDAGVVESAQTLTSSDFTVAATGRATATITSNGINLNYVFYVVSSSEMLMMAIDSAQTPPVILAGQVLQQSGTFTDASLDGASVIELQSLTNTGAGPSVTAGVITTTGTTAYAITADQNQGGTMGTLTETGTLIFGVGGSGRVTLTPNGGGSTRVFYLIAQNQAFAVGTNMGVDYGMLSPQTSGSFTIASLSGTYLGGSQPPVSASVNEEADNINSNGAGSLTGTADKNSTGGTQSGTFSATYSVSSGGPNERLILSESNVPVLYLYMISTSQFVALPVSSSQNPNPDPKLIDFHQ